MLLVIFGALWGLDYYRGRGDPVALEAGSQQSKWPYLMWLDPIDVRWNRTVKVVSNFNSKNHDYRAV